MKHNKSLIVITLMLIVVVVLLNSYSKVNAQKGVVRYLETKFAEQNLPVVEIVVVEENPLRLQIVIQSSDNWIDTVDMDIANTINRDVFISARKEGYPVESLISILQNSDGIQLDRTEKNVDSSQLDQTLSLNLALPILDDETTKNLLLERITPYFEEYQLVGIPTEFEISSADEYKKLNIVMQVSSIDDANKGAYFFWSLPRFSLFSEVNAEGANLAIYRAKIIDETGATLLDFLYDFQLGSGGWTQDKRLIHLGDPPTN